MGSVPQAKTVQTAPNEDRRTLPSHRLCTTAVSGNSRTQSRPERKKQHVCAAIYPPPSINSHGYTAPANGRPADPRFDFDSKSLRDALTAIMKEES